MFSILINMSGRLLDFHVYNTKYADHNFNISWWQRVLIMKWLLCAIVNIRLLEIKVYFIFGPVLTDPKLFYLLYINLLLEIYTALFVSFPFYSFWPRLFLPRLSTSGILHVLENIFYLLMTKLIKSKAWTHRWRLEDGSRPPKN